jgi:hypothetical protein
MYLFTAKKNTAVLTAVSFSFHYAIVTLMPGPIVVDTVTDFI